MTFPGERVLVPMTMPNPRKNYCKTYELKHSAILDLKKISLKNIAFTFRPILNIAQYFLILSNQIVIKNYSLTWHQQVIYRNRRKIVSFDILTRAYLKKISIK